MTKTKTNEELPVGSILKKSWDYLTKNISMLAIFAVISVVMYLVYYFIVIGGIFSTGLGFADVIFQSSKGSAPIFGGLFTGLGLMWLMLAVLVSIFISTLIMGALTYAVYAIVNDKKIQAMDAFKSAFKKFWIFLGTSIVVAIIVGLGTMMLVLPGLIAAMFLVYTYYVIVAEDLGVGKAISRSFELAKNSWLLILVMGVIGWAIMLVAGYIPLVNLVSGPILSVFFSIVIALMYNYAKAK